MALDYNTLNKLITYLEEMISQLEEKQVTEQKLQSDADLLFSIEHRLHTAIEAIINISEHIVAGLNLGHVDYAKDTFKVLSKEGIISKDLTERLEKAADMRNILIHQYFEIDVRKIADAATSDLKDLREFAKAINEFLEKQGEVVEEEKKAE